MTSPHVLKELQSRRAALDARLKRLGEERAETSRLLAECAAAIGRLDEKIAALTKQPTVTEHAMLRYLERAEGLDLAALADKILTKEIRERIDQFNSGRFPLGDTGLRAVVKNKVVVSVVEKGRHKR